MFRSRDDSSARDGITMDCKKYSRDRPIAIGGRIGFCFVITFLEAALGTGLLNNTTPAANGKGVSAASSQPRYRMDSWTTKEGLPQNSVLTLAQTQDGYLWIGTLFGLARFDGIRFVTFNEKNTPAFQSHTINSLCVDKDGTLWAGTADGLIRRKDGEFRRFGEEDGLPDGKILQVKASPKGGVWIRCSTGGLQIALWRDGQCQAARDFRTLTGKTRDLSLSGHDRQWVVTSEGIRGWEYDDVPANDSHAFVGVEGAYSVLEDAAGILWIGTEGGVEKHDGASSEFFAFPNTFAREPGEFLTLDSKGMLWASTGRGVLRRQENGWAAFRPPETLSGDACSPVLEDREGNFWFGSRKTGLHRIRLGRLKALSTSDGLVNESVWSICESREGGLWVGTGKGVSYWNQGKFVNYGYEEGLPRGWVTTVCELRNGDVWAGMRTGTAGDSDNAPFLARIVRDRFESISPPALAGLHRVWTIHQESSGIIWIGTGEGLIRYEEDSLQQFSTGEELSHEDVRVILEGQEGELWIGTNGGGLIHYWSGQFRHYTTEDGLSNNNVWAIHQGAGGALWIGTEYGLNRFKNGEFTSYFMEQGLFDDLVNQILEDDFGNLWISCNRGIYRVRKKELDAFADGVADLVHSIAYGEADGMLSSETNGECQPAGCRTRNGQLVFPTARGFVVIDPEELIGRSDPPPVVIEKLAANGEPAESSWMASSGRADERKPELQLSSGAADMVEIRYTANSLVEPRDVRFRYRLLGAHENWIEAGTRRVAYFFNLKPGHYRFEVIACDHNGIWNMTGASLAYVITPRFHETAWFFWLTAVVVVALAALIHFFRLRHRMRVAGLERQAALDSERSRIAQDMHDEMGATLAQISLLCERSAKGRTEAGTQQQSLERIKNRSRELARSMDGLVWAMNPKHDTLESLIAYMTQYASNYLKSAGITCRLRLPPPKSVPPCHLASETRHNLLLACKEALTNIVKHAQPTEASVECSIQSFDLVITISDNGRGLLAAESHSGFRHGLEGMESRIEQIGGQFDLRQRDQGGTEVRFQLDLRRLERT